MSLDGARRRSVGCGLWRREVASANACEIYATVVAVPSLRLHSLLAQDY